MNMAEAVHAGGYRAIETSVTPNAEDHDRLSRLVRVTKSIRRSQPF
jgi:hypothetical protein